MKKIYHKTSKYINTCAYKKSMLKKIMNSFLLSSKKIHYYWYLGNETKNNNKFHSFDVPLMRIFQKSETVIGFFPLCSNKFPLVALLLENNG